VVPDFMDRQLLPAVRNFSKCKFNPPFIKITFFS
jgi:hypothetical protein